MYPNKSEVYSQAWKVLNDHYGNSFRLQNKVRQELVSAPPIKDSDTIQLNDLQQRQTIASVYLKRMVICPN